MPLIEKTQKKATKKKNGNSPRFSLFSNKTLQLIDNVLNNQKQNKSHKKIRTKKKTKLKKTKQINTRQTLKPTSFSNHLHKQTLTTQMTHPTRIKPII